MIQSNLKDFPELKKLSFEMQLMNLEFKRMELYQELTHKCSKHPEDRKYYIKIYLYETRKIDKNINELRALALMK